MISVRNTIRHFLHIEKVRSFITSRLIINPGDNTWLNTERLNPISYLEIRIEMDVKMT
jgi:hypothetical protein